MAESLGRLCKGLLLAGLAIYVLLKGVIPGLTAVTTDFPVYFTAATLARDGHDGVKFYDGEWFREQTRRLGIGPTDNPGAFAPNPPPVALLLLPLTSLAPLTALRVMIVLDLLCLIGAAWLLRRLFAWRVVDAALFILLSGWALQSGLRFGQPYILMSTCCLLGYFLYVKRMPWLAGLCFGVFTPLKYYPVTFLAGFALQRQWRAVLGGGLAIAAIVLLSAAVLGWKVHQIFLLEVFFNHLSGHINPAPSFTVVFQSFDTLFSRLFILDPVENPHPFWVAPLARTVAVIVTKGLLVVAAAMALIRHARGVCATAIAPVIGILGILTLLIAPGTSTYTFALLWLPVAALVDYFLSENARVPAYIVLGAYALIGFIPYGHTSTFEGDGGLTVLAYPRLFLLLTMYLVGVYAVASRATDTVRAQ